MKVTAQLPVKRAAALLLCLLLGAALFAPLPAHAEGSGKTVRVGWYDSSYNTLDSTGRRTGYACEYQIKIAAYTGWRYHYVSGSWPELLEMLEKGEIDREEKDVQLVALILNIARSLNIPVVAEGVETEEQIKLLKALGCSIVQGFFSLPLHATDFEETFVRKLPPAA